MFKKAVIKPIILNTLKGGQPGQVSFKGIKRGGTGLKGLNFNYENSKVNIFKLISGSS